MFSWRIKGWVRCSLSRPPVTVRTSVRLFWLHAVDLQLWLSSAEGDGGRGCSQNWGTRTREGLKSGRWTPLTPSPGNQHRQGVRVLASPSGGPTPWPAESRVPRSAAPQGCAQGRPGPPGAVGCCGPQRGEREPWGQNQQTPTPLGGETKGLEALTSGSTQGDEQPGKTRRIAIEALRRCVSPWSLSMGGFSLSARKLCLGGSHLLGIPGGQL